MTKAELVEEVARAAELTKKDSEVIVEEVFKNIIQALNRGEKIELRGFGSFRVRQRDARRGRNPKTGAPVDIPAKRVPYFKPGKELKELINAQADGDGFEAAVFDDDDDDDDDVDEIESVNVAAEAVAES
jgi:integration host factor subunit beta